MKILHGYILRELAGPFIVSLTLLTFILFMRHFVFLFPKIAATVACRRPLRIRPVNPTPMTIGKPEPRLPTAVMEKVSCFQGPDPAKHLI